MAAGSLPLWDGRGILPPIKPGMKGNSPERSPYQIALPDLIDRFASSPERIKILSGLLDFRKELHKLGLVSGFQWLDGSFLENIETLESRPPHDLDVVTFYNLPKGETQHSLLSKHTDIFSSVFLKKRFSIDGYFLSLGTPSNAQQIKSILYWYSMWSHRRDGLWKGFIQVDLDISQDENAYTILNMSREVPNE
jgi:hypothetical protein